LFEVVSADFRVNQSYSLLSVSSLISQTGYF